MKKINILMIILIVGLLSVFGCKVDPVNTPPDVNAGPDDQFNVNTDYQLQGVVSDDNIPLNGQLTSQWSVVSGQVSAVEFEDVAKPDSFVRFLVQGTYTLSLVASDGELQNSDDVIFIVGAEELLVFEPGVWVEAEDGVLVAPIQKSADGNLIFTPTGTSTDYAGSASYTFDVKEAGKYRLNTVVNAPDSSSNSFFVGLDSENAQGDINKRWDVAVAGDFGGDYVNWRGVADPKEWDLSVGEHTFIFWGREANTQLDKIYLEKVYEIDCVKGDWVDDSCGAGNCNDNEMRQTRTVNPANCDITQQCVLSTSCSDDLEIVDIEFDWDNKQQYALGSDLWPITWANDNNLYTTYGDGAGFGATYAESRDSSKGRVTIGVSRIEGGPEANTFEAFNVWGGKNAENPVQDPFICQQCGKPSTILAIDDFIYAVFEGGLYRSTNFGATWELYETGWNNQDSFARNAFLNYGKAYSDAPDNYVYIYGTDYTWGDVSTYDKIYLARISKDKLNLGSEYEFLRGLDSNGNPLWSKDVNQKQPVMQVTHDPPEIGAIAVSYNKGIGKYLMTGHNKNYVGKWTIYSADYPWGPWKTVKQYKDWQGFGDLLEGMQHSFPTKWMSEDGKTMWMVWSGKRDGQDIWDSFNLVKVTLKLSNEDPTEIFEVNDIRANQPKNFRLTSSGNDVTLRWDWNENAPVSAFKVYRSETGNEPWVRPSGGKIYDSSARMFVDKDLQIGKRYHYLVQAVHGNPEVNSLISQDKQIIVGGGEPDDVIPSPTNVKASYDGNTITVTWDYEPKAGVSLGGFKIDKSYEYGSWERPDGGRIVNTNARSFVDEPNLPSGVYMYRVFGWYSSNNYPFSETVAVKID